MKTKLTTIILLLVSITSFTQTFTVDFINYNVTATNPNTVEVTGTSNAGGLGGNLIIPEIVTDNDIDYTVTSIAFRAFRDKKSIVSVTIPATMVLIGSEAFEDNPITEVTVLATTPPSIGSGVFDNRDTIDITIPAGTEVAYNNANWTGFLTVNGNAPIGTNFNVDGITYQITSSADPKTVVLKNGNNAVGDLTIPETVTLNTIDFSVTAIGDEAFRDNTEITTVTAESTIAPILGTNVFLGISNDVTLTVPENSETDYDAKGWNSNFFSVNGNPGIGATFEANGITYQITAANPNEVSLTNSNDVTGDFIIPEIVTLNTIDFSVTAIGNNAIDGSLLNSITATSNTPITLGTNSFGNNESLNLIIPNNSEEAYALAGWTGFFSVNNVLNEDLLGETFTIDGIKYSIIALSPAEVKVTGANTTTTTTTTTDLVIPEVININSFTFNVTVIGGNSFRDTTITSVVIPNNVTIIEGSAFRGSDLVTVQIGSGLETIEELAFAGVTTITNFEVNATVAPTIGANAIPNRRAINLKIPEGTEEAYATGGWTVFFSVNEIISVGESITLNGLTYTVIATPNVVELTNGNEVSGNITIPSSIPFGDFSVTVSSIKAGAFNGNLLTSVSIPSSITSIGDSAFSNNELTTIVIPNSINAIGNNVFQNNNITNLNIPSTIISIGANAFSNNQLTSIIIPENVTSIGESAFTNNVLTEVIAAGNTPATIETNTFGDRTNINLTIPEDTEAAYETENWTGFLSVNGQIDDNFIGISFQFNEINYIITSINPNQVEVTGSSIEFNLIIPEIATFNNFDFNVTTIKGGAFRDSSLTSLVIPDNVTTIGASAFRGSKLVSIILGSGLETIGELAFAGNGSQISITVKAILPPSIGANAIAKRAQTDLTIPKGTTNAYQNSDWTGFKSYIEISELSLQLKVFLQGASLNPNSSEEDLMRDDLRVGNLLPTTSPYSDALTTTTTVFETEGENAIVDWVFIELRDATDNTIVVEAQSALLQRDGDIVALDGVSDISFTEDIGDYFVSINHRNHLGIITASPISLSSTLTNLDFTTDASLIEGGTTALETLSPGVFGLYSGNFNQDSSISITDRNNVQAVLGERDIYTNADMDMNGVVQISEITNLVNTNLGNVQQFTTILEE